MLTMTQEERDLLLKDLSGRLPYGVILNCCNSIGEKLTSIDENGLVNHDYDIDEIKPYLFPLSSMTEEEWKEYQTLKMVDWVKGDINGTFINAGTITDWLNAHHFDYRGLIPMGLAKDATGLNIY